MLQKRLQILDCTYSVLMKKAMQDACIGEKMLTFATLVTITNKSQTHSSMHDSGPKLYLGTFEVNRKNKQAEKFSFQTHRYF